MNFEDCPKLESQKSKEKCWKHLRNKENDCFKMLKEEIYQMEEER